MLVIIGAITVVVCVLGGYAAMGGHLYVLWQPFEVVIICGAALGAFMIGNPKPVIMGTLKCFGKALKGSKYNRKAYMELLGLMFTLFKLAKSKGALALEVHVEKPEESEIFKRFPTVLNDHHATVFLCDYIRLVTIGADNAMEIEALMDAELDTHHHEEHRIAAAVQTIADGLPALGIVAAVLGVIKTMGSISEPPEVLGKLIGGALVGTFLGVWLAYGFVGPLANILKSTSESEAKYYFCMKAGMLAYMQGYAPAIAVEFARKALESDVRPTFYEVEEAMAELPT